MSADWHAEAACRDLDPELFFPTGTGRGCADDAKQVCRQCPVRRECLDACMASEGYGRRWCRFGVFGGLTPSERDRLPERVRVAA